jgi:acyl-coenzyme A synthetase/AMP-(fatty) acid ligase
LGAYDRTAREMADNLTTSFPSFVDAVLFQALHQPSSPAIGTEAGVITFGQLGGAIRAATVRCVGLGLRPGSLVALVVADPVWHICLIAALYRNAVATMSASAQEVTALSELGLSAVLYDVGAPAGCSIPCQGVTPDWFTSASSEAPGAPHSFGAADLCRVALSSGTTGRPKPIAMSPQIVWHRLTTFMFRGGFGSSERIYCGGQLHSNFGFSVAFAALTHGKMVSSAFPLMSYLKVDLAMLAVYQLAVMAEFEHGRSSGLGSLREIQAGGALISDVLLQRARAAFPARLVAAYASTEAGTAAIAPVEALGEARSQGAVGFITPWTSVDVCDDDDRILPAGSEGNLRIRALGLAAPYQPGTKRVEPPEFFFPGDVGRVRADSMLMVAGRAAEVINIGGNKIAPELFENVLMQCAGVRDAAVFTVDIGSALPQTWAAIVADTPVNIEELIKRCAAVPMLGAPAVVKLVPSIPRSGTGKIQRDRLRDALARSDC